MSEHIMYELGYDILALRSCYHQDGADLLAVAGDGSVEVLQCGESKMRQLAYFRVGLKVTSIAWSPRSVSPGASDEWFLELAISTDDFGLHLLSKSYDASESVRRFGGGLTGHHARVNDMSFVGGQEDNARHIATVSDDRNLIVWDLHPTVTNDLDSDDDFQPSMPEYQPTALVIPFAYPLCSVASHPSTSKEFLVSDSRGSVFLIDWRKDPNDDEEEAFSHQNILELVHPKSLADAAANMPKFLSGCASWRVDDPNIVGAVFGSEYALWDIGRLQGGKPYITFSSFPEGGHRFRWCPTYTEYFAISPSTATAKGAEIAVHNIYHLTTPSQPLHLFPTPHRITDFDWIGSHRIPRLAAAIGRDIYVLPISSD